MRGSKDINTKSHYIQLRSCVVLLKIIIKIFFLISPLPSHLARDMPFPIDNNGPVLKDVSRNEVK